MHASKVAEESLSEALPLLTGGKDSCFKNYILKVVSLTTETTSNIYERQWQFIMQLSPNSRNAIIGV